MDKRGGGISSFSVEKCFSHCAEKFRREIILCSVSEIFSVAKKFIDKGVRGNQDFPSKKFSLIVPKISQGNLSLLH